MLVWSRVDFHPVLMRWIAKVAHVSSVFLALEPRDLGFRVDNIPHIKYYTQKEDIILLYIGYHRIPK